MPCRPHIGAIRSEPGQQQCPAKDSAPGRRMHQNNDPTKLEPDA
jgi:hypothetical protein